MMNYLVLPRMYIKNANAQPVWWIIGAPAITAYAGFCHALALALGLEKCQGFSIIHHDIQLLGEFEREGKTFQPHQFRAAAFINKQDYSSKNKYVLSTQPTARCHLTVSLVIRLDEEDAIDETALEKFLRSGRIAGGSITGFNKLRFCERVEEVSQYLKTGFAIHERQDLMVMQEDDQDLLDTVLRLTERKTYSNIDTKNLNQQENNKLSKDDLNWLQASTLGYQAITPFQHRNNVRGDFPHAFAEPLVGLIQYKNIRSHRLPFWQATNPNPNTFILTTN